jgi:nicotinate dehydrogenase subunit B
MDLAMAVNPLQLKRQVQAGCLFGVGQALHEEVMFDEGAFL